MFPINCWYVAAYAHEVTNDAPYPCQVADNKIILYRDENNQVVAMADRCCHRLAPLSLGRIEGSDIRCMYHGIKFGSDGACVAVPGQKHVPKSFCIQTFAVEERHQWVWVWIGDRNHPDLSLLPDVQGQDPEIYGIQKDAIDYNANYQLLNDNLCDLSHVAFVHENTLGANAGKDDWALSKPDIENLPRGLRFTRWFSNQSAGKGFDAGDQRFDMWIKSEYLIPGILLMNSHIYPTGVAAQFDFGEPQGIKPLSSVWNTQAVTPKDEKTMRYFYCLGIPHNEPTYGLHGNFDIMNVAFSEDKRMIEAQQKVIEENPTARLATTSHDKAIVYFRKLIQKASL